MLRALEGILLKILSLLSVWYSVQFSMYLLSASCDLGIISGARERKTSNIQLNLIKMFFILYMSSDGNFLLISLK